MTLECDSCSSTNRENKGQFWFCNGYHGWTGTFCPDCHELISHDSYGNPNHPKEYTKMLLKFSGAKIRE